ncbi:hypothetical protein KDA_57690 [Dictyobacter alpinus]|uniref:Uncharacterized protein n=1 Tax=Dictyobacter alpinus TaxID=2014873 RepID=A0A402BFW9_9CHLR|nr:hypothetical protein [Dictyobacter alpinus]GCE30285.1 hypothetical protein KDA_57690 [Dictyobacter alpinus]
MDKSNVDNKKALLLHVSSQQKEAKFGAFERNLLDQRNLMPVSSA